MKWLCVFFAIGCTQVTTQTKTLTNMADMDFTVEGVAFKGATVVQRKVTQVIRFTFPKDTERLVVTTCHRNKVFLSPVSPFEYRYLPKTFLENWGSCILRASAITKGGVVVQAIIDFTSNEAMKARSYCDGEEADGNGASFCQSLAGTKQMMRFDEPVDIQGEEDRCAPIACDGQYCYYFTSPGYCIYAIKGLKTGQRHRLTTRGYITNENL
jgi:hypothetical protein